MIWGTSDLHLGHKNITKYCNRPFNTLKEMDDKIIDNCNQLVGIDDILINCGDFAFGCLSTILSYRKRINCKNIYLCLGNHDREIKRRKARLAPYFHIVDYLECKIDYKLCIFNHYSLADERNLTKKLEIDRSMYYAGFSAEFYHGHTHKDEPNNLGVDSHNFYPVRLGLEMS